MVWSMGAVLVVVVLQLTVTHRSHQQVVYPVDYPGTVAQATTDHVLDLVIPRAVPTGFTATAARYEPESLGEPGDMRLYLGFTSSDGQYISVWQSNGHASDVIAAATNSGACDATIDIVDRTWDVCVTLRPLTRSLVWHDQKHIIVVAGAVDSDALAAFARTLQPAS